jgi:hypothetical protein
MNSFIPPNTVFHGSGQVVKYPSPERGRSNTDFGQGFYCTRNLQQAIEWAIKTDSKNPIINVYQLSDISTLRYKNFDTYSMDWLDCVAAFRSDRQPEMPYDIIEGPVADRGLFINLAKYRNKPHKRIDVLQSMSQFGDSNQLCFKTWDSIEYLNIAGYQNAYVLKKYLGTYQRS